jgi:hypothetical protein
LLQCFHEFDVKWTFWTDAFVLVHKKNISSDHVLSAQPVDIVKKADFFTYGFSSDTRRSEKGWMLQNSLKLFFPAIDKSLLTRQMKLSIRYFVAIMRLGGTTTSRVFILDLLPLPEPGIELLTLSSETTTRPLPSRVACSKSRSKA